MGRINNALPARVSGELGAPVSPLLPLSVTPETVSTSLPAQSLPGTGWISSAFSFQNEQRRQSIRRSGQECANNNLRHEEGEVSTSWASLLTCPALTCPCGFYHLQPWPSSTSVLGSAGTSTPGRVSPLPQALGSARTHSGRPHSFNRRSQTSWGQVTLKVTQQGQF